MKASARLSAYRATSRTAAMAGPVTAGEYGALVQRVRAAVRASVPEGARVAVVSRGDPALLDFGGRRGWHFPQAAGGGYAGHHPADGAEAIADLEGLRGRGAEFLVLPSTAAWWLDHYPDFRAHLDGRYRVIADLPDTCLIFDLRGQFPQRSNEGGPSRRVEHTRPPIQVTEWPL